VTERPVCRLVAGRAAEPRYTKMMSRKFRILAVDDDQGVRFTLAMTLERAGFQVIEAEDGEQAARIIKHESVDLIITDLDMPRTDGLALMTSLRSKGVNTPIILQTASVIMDEAKALAAGATAFMEKPLDPDELIAVIESLLPTK
jgi:DNA-binding response OmpR family regulator